jgi:hypothetical protein
MLKKVEVRKVLSHLVREQIARAPSRSIEPGPCA